MRKTWIFLIVLALLAISLPVFADGPAAPTLKFSMLGFWWANVDPSITAASNTVNSGQQRVWPTMDVAFDANNTFELGLRMPNNTDKVTGYGTNVPSSTDLAGSLWHFMWTSDLTAAAGMKDSPVDVKATIGVMDSVLTNWWYDNNGWEWEYGGASATPGTNWDAGLVTINADSNFLGYGLAVGAGPVIFHWVNDFSLHNTLVGAEGAFGPLGLYAAYGVYQGETADKGNLALEAKYDIPQISDITLKPSIFFRDQFFTGGTWVFGGDLTVAYQIFKLIVGATTTSEVALQHYSATFHALPSSPADIWIAAYLDGASPDNAPLQAVDIGASYTFGSFKLIAGWVIGGKDQTNNDAGVHALQTDMGNYVTLGNDNVGRIANGLYFGSAINF